jgi:hypothetical protein
MRSFGAAKAPNTCITRLTGSRFAQVELIIAAFYIHVGIEQLDVHVILDLRHGENFGILQQLLGEFLRYHAGGGGVEGEGRDAGCLQPLIQPGRAETRGAGDKNQPLNKQDCGKGKTEQAER